MKMLFLLTIDPSDPTDHSDIVGPFFGRQQIFDHIKEVHKDPSPRAWINEATVDNFDKISFTNANLFEVLVAKSPRETVFADPWVIQFVNTMDRRVWVGGVYTNNDVADIAHNMQDQDNQTIEWPLNLHPGQMIMVFDKADPTSVFVASNDFFDEDKAHKADPTSV